MTPGRDSLTGAKNFNTSMDSDYTLTTTTRHLIPLAIINMSWKCQSYLLLSHKGTCLISKDSESLDNRLAQYLRGSVSFVAFEERPKRALDLGCGVCDQCYTQFGDVFTN